MNDAERDAWLREALRHAPDSQALPPRGVSEAILAEARAAAKKEQAVPARAVRAARTHPLAAFWDWLARPPVAAGFASVMAATLVGLMWWDRPLDETLPRRPDAVSDRAPAPASAGPVAPTQSTAPLAKNEERTSGTRTMPATEGGRVQNKGAGEAAPSGRMAAAGEGAAVRDDKVAPSPPTDKRKRAGAIAQDSAAREERKAQVQAPAPFAPTENERDALAAKTAPAAKKDEARPPVPAAEARAPSDATVAQSSVAAEAAAAPAAPPAAARLRVQPEASPPLARRRADGDDARTTAGGASLDAAKSAPAPVTAAAPAAVPAPGLRSGTRGDGREKQASAFGSAPAAAPPPPAGLAAPAAPTRNEVAAERQNAVAAAPLAAVLAAIANEPARWSRASASGNVVALDAGWRYWLAQLDAAAAGRWRSLAGASAAADSARGDATTLRLLSAGRLSAVVRIEGTTVRIDGPAPGERWQANLPAEAAERLRAAAARLPP